MIPNFRQSCMFVVSCYISIGRSEELPAEVACLDITPLCGESKADLCSVGLWDITALIIKLEDLSVLHREQLGGGEFVQKSLA